MKYALVDGQRQEAQPGLSGICQACDGPMVARCGEVRVRHWAHRIGNECDHWWEPETEWHRSWKDQFPADWQEVVHVDGPGDRHIADVKTDRGWVLEFQHSPIRRDERESREAFYEKMIWIVDATRRKRDESQFRKACERGSLIVRSLGLARIPIPDECALLRDWAGCSCPVFFDFSASVWCVFRVINGAAYGAPLSREGIIRYHSPGAGQDFSTVLREINAYIDAVAMRRQVLSDPRAAILQRTERRYQERLRSKRIHF